MNKERFGTFIAENRKQMGLTQAQLAEQLHVTDKAVSKWERGLSYPDVTLLEPLADVFDISIDALLRCQSPTDDREEQKMDEKNESIQTVVEISKETVQRKKWLNKVLIVALIGVVIFTFLVVIPAAVKAYRNYQNEKHTVMISDGNIEILCVEREEGEQIPGRFRCVVAWEDKLLSLRYTGNKTEKDLLTSDRAIKGENPGLTWSYATVAFTYDDRTDRGEITAWGEGGGRGVIYNTQDDIRTEKPLFGLENTCLMRDDYGYLLFYQPVEGDLADGSHAMKLFLRLPKPLADKEFTITDCDDDGVNELIVPTGWDIKSMVTYDYENGKVVAHWTEGMKEAK